MQSTNIPGQNPTFPKTAKGAFGQWGFGKVFTAHVNAVHACADHCRRLNSSTEAITAANKADAIAECLSRFIATLQDADAVEITGIEQDLCKILTSHRNAIASLLINLGVADDLLNRKMEQAVRSTLASLETATATLLSEALTETLAREFVRTPPRYFCAVLA